MQEDKFKHIHAFAPQSWTHLEMDSSRGTTHTGKHRDTHGTCLGEEQSRWKPALIALLTFDLKVKRYQKGWERKTHFCADTHIYKLSFFTHTLTLQYFAGKFSCLLCGGEGHYQLASLWCRERENATVTIYHWLITTVKCNNLNHGPSCLALKTGQTCNRKNRFISSVVFSLKGLIGTTGIFLLVDFLAWSKKFKQICKIKGAVVGEIKLLVLNTYQAPMTLDHPFPAF